MQILVPEAGGLVWCQLPVPIMWPSIVATSATFLGTDAALQGGVHGVARRCRGKQQSSQSGGRLVKDTEPRLAH